MKLNRNISISLGSLSAIVVWNVFGGKGPSLLVYFLWLCVCVCVCVVMSCHAKQCISRLMLSELETNFSIKSLQSSLLKSVGNLEKYKEFNVASSFASRNGNSFLLAY
jgi:hypothetical protein